MPRSYAPQFRAMVVDQVRNGKRVAEVAASVELCEATVFRWVRQDKIDRGEMPRMSRVPWNFGGGPVMFRRRPPCCSRSV